MKYKSEREVKAVAEVDNYLIDRKKPSNTRCFVEMYPDGTFGWHWGFYDNNKCFEGPCGVFEDVTAPENIQSEIKNRSWGDEMSSELQIFADSLWDKFFEVNSNIPRE